MCAWRHKQPCRRYLTAKLADSMASPAIASAVAAVPSGASVVLRVVAGASLAGTRRPVGLTLLQIYLDSSKMAAIQSGGGHSWCLDGAWRDRVDYVGAPEMPATVWRHLRRMDGCRYWLFLRHAFRAAQLDCPVGSDANRVDRPSHGSTNHGQWTLLCH